MPGKSRYRTMRSGPISLVRLRRLPGLELGGDKLARMKPTGQLSEMLDNVSDEKSFLQFVEALIADRRLAVAMQKESPTSPWGPDAGGWENTSIENFLGSAVAWATDSNFGTNQGLSASNPWKRFAVFLLAGKIYE